MNWKEYMALPFDERLDLFSKSMGYSTYKEEKAEGPIQSVKVEPYFPEPEVVDTRESMNRKWEIEQINSN